LCNTFGIPAGIAGILFDDIIESFFDSQILLVGFMLLLTAVLLFLADRAKKTERICHGYRDNKRRTFEGRIGRDIVLLEKRHGILCSVTRIKDRYEKCS